MDVVLGVNPIRLSLNNISLLVRLRDLVGVHFSDSQTES